MATASTRSARRQAAVGSARRMAGRTGTRPDRRWGLGETPFVWVRMNPVPLSASPLPPAPAPHPFLHLPFVLSSSVDTVVYPDAGHGRQTPRPRYLARTARLDTTSGRSPSSRIPPPTTPSSTQAPPPTIPSTPPGSPPTAATPPSSSGDCRKRAGPSEPMAAGWSVSRTAI